MRHIAWGIVAALGVALLALGPPAHAQSGSGGTSGSTASGQPGGASASGSSGSSDTGSGASKLGPDTKSGSNTGMGSPSAGSSGSGASASSDTGSSHQLSGTVQKFDKDSKELTLSSSDKKLKVSDSTKVTKDGQPASTSDIHEGDQVRASYSGTGNDVDVVQIEIVPAEKAPGK